MKKAFLPLPMLALGLAIPLSAHPSEEGAERCHMHKETGALHCPKRKEADAPAPQTRPMRSREVYYRGCREARAAGVTPIRRGEPGYREGLDGDNDGWACERYIRPRR
ncbi:excalibur calcium-binding domain-containing protein [Qipengyuania xiamenensis]|uniref:excalibur calcium-binding domain-containing protein n=1 Tax=Qipengyuania xiamenensis TaxID=2867237 RepID=UPI001FFC834E|nr:excalibur calcium-binding domain-containing protein [Qipengyuania xiamenensis]